jgi:Leucine-rich repeat (LRR) protein
LDAVQLNFDDNALTEIPSNFLIAAPNKIETISFGGNSITHIAPDAFRYFVGLHYLDLKQNLLSSLPVGMFQFLTNLTFLGLSENKFTSVPVLGYMPALEQLVLGGNSLVSVDPGAFIGVAGTLNALDLSSAFLVMKAVPANIFSLLVDLAILDLRDNFLTSLPDSVFDDCAKSLQSVNLNVGSFF